MLRTLIKFVALAAYSAALAEEPFVTDEMRAMFAEVRQAAAVPKSAVSMAIIKDSPDCRAGNIAGCGTTDRSPTSLTGEA